MRARVIFNPTSGREIVKKHLVEIFQVYEEAGYETSAYATTPEPKSAQNEAERAARAGFDLIVAAGGDGTINEVVNGMAGLKKRPKLAIIPAGTTNDYARALHIPRNNLVEAAKIIHKKQSFFMDVGEAVMGKDLSYFINIGGGGMMTELTYDVPSQLKTIFGYLAYFVKGAEILPRIKPIPMHIEYDDGTFEGEATMFLVALTNSIGGFEQIAPDALLDDGKFTLIIVKTSNLPDVLRLVAQVLNGGKHITNPNILYKKTSKIIARPGNASKMMINLDGEYGGNAPVVFTNLHQHIEIIASTDDLQKAVDHKDETSEVLEDAFIKEVEGLTNSDINGDGEIHSSTKEAYEK
ncbi:diacylglycerol kinase [Carnobacterium sp. ISL-102]|uniref:diacylglycerol kinase n=1 Tax=Carnobacterium sp. ISL-102 TaxID=2819142 RepID=UPI001BE7EF65|nr:diacylglycerol kinase [Carnobacterium sp. ISL-102]MBT2731151.1 diacylglycerol kinase [Carnobacterium sp. ISL-102]